MLRRSETKIKYPNCCPACEDLLVAHGRDGCMVKDCDCQMRGGLLPGSTSSEEMFAFLSGLSAPHVNDDGETAEDSGAEKV